MCCDRFHVLLRRFTLEDSSRGASGSHSFLCVFARDWLSLALPDIVESCRNYIGLETRKIMKTLPDTQKQKTEKSFLFLAHCELYE